MKLLQPRRFHPLRTLWVLLFLGAYFLYTTNRDRAPRLWAWKGEAFGSTYGVQLAAARLTESSVEALRTEVEACLAGLNNRMSTWRPESDLSRFNTNLTTEPVAVAADLAEVAGLALEVSRRSGGAFDCTYHPLFQLWGFGGTGPHRLPAEEEIARVRADCGWSNLHVRAPHQLQKDLPGLQFNLNALAPGYAAERLAQLLTARGFTNFYVDVGGEEVCRGGKTATQPWRLGIETPVRDAEPGAHLSAVVRLRDGALATSGDYRSFFDGEDGRIYSHIFDPRLGRPATTLVASVSVVFTNGAWADALATTLFVMGPGEGLPWLTNVPGAEAYFLMHDGEALREISSTGFARYLAP